METHQIRGALKRGPRLSRQMRAEYALGLARKPLRHLTPGLIAEIRSEVERLSHSANSAVQRFVRVMRARYPEILG